MIWKYFWNNNTSDIKNEDNEKEIENDSETDNIIENKDNNIENNNFDIETNEVVVSSIENILDDEDDETFEFISKNDLFISENKESFVIISDFLNKYFKKNNNINSFLKEYQLLLNNKSDENNFEKEKLDDIQKFLIVFIDLYESKYYCEKKYLNLLYLFVNKYKGLGWRELFKTIIKFLIANEINIDYEKIIYDLCLISRYDVLFTFIGTQYEEKIYNILSDILITDRLNYQFGKYNEITSLAFWIHNEKTKINKLHNFNYNLSYNISKRTPNLYIKAIEKNSFRVNKSIYLKILRTQFLAPLKNVLINNKNKIKNNTKNNNKNIDFNKKKHNLIKSVNNNVENFNGYLNYIV